MAILREFIRPATIAEADRLLHERGHSAALLAGGSGLVADLERRLRPDIDTVIDLSHLGLSWVRASGDMLHLGACATLTDVIEYPAAASLADRLLVRAAHGEGPVHMRNAATVGGVVATASPDSEFYAALLALDAVVLSTDNDKPVAIDTIGPGPRILLEVRIPLRPCRGGHARVARTPADRPIVAALAVADAAGTRVALCGVAATPILEGASAQPFSDFKGSAEYRLAMAPIVAARARQETL